MDLSTRDGRRKQGERIKQAAREAGLTLEELAHVIGCSRALIFQYASGASLPQSDRLQQIAHAVGKPLYWFFLDDMETPDSGVSTPESGSVSVDRARLDEERLQLDRERSGMETRRIRDDVMHLEALLAAAAAPIDHRKVVECCQQLQQLLAIEMREDPDRLAAVLLQHGNALIQLQEWGAAKEKLEQASALYTRAGKPVLARDCAQSLGHANLMLGRVEEALKQFEGVAAGDDWTNRWQGTLSTGAAHEMLGNYPAAIEALEAALAIVEEPWSPGGDSDRQPQRTESELEIARLYIEANWANIELDFGDYIGALARAERCIHIAQRRGVQDQYIEALLTAGAAGVALGRLTSGSATIQQALDVSLLIGDRQHQSLSLSCIASCEIARRRAGAAITRGKEALALALRCNAVRAELLAQRALCGAYLCAANPSEALYHAEQGRALAGDGRLFLQQVQFNVLKAQALLASDDAQEAITIATRTLEMASEPQIRPVLLDCHYLIARALLSNGDGKSALQHALKAIDLAESMHLRHELWRFHGAAALSKTHKQRSDEYVPALVSAIELMQSARNREEMDEEFTLMEDPAAIDLWKARLHAALRSHGRDEARALAEQSEWPPLAEWLELLIVDEGEKPDD